MKSGARAPGTNNPAYTFTLLDRDMVKLSCATFAFVLVWSTSATAIETPAAGLYRVLTDLCLDRYLRDRDLNDAQLNTGRPLIVHCDCMARFLVSYMDADAIRRWRRAFQTKLRQIGMMPLECSALLLRSPRPNTGAVLMRACVAGRLAIPRKPPYPSPRSGVRSTNKPPPGSKARRLWGQSQALCHE